MTADQDDDRPIADDLIEWQHQAQTEPLDRLAAMARGELNDFAAALNEFNQILAEPSYTEDAVAVEAAAVVEAMRLGTLAAIHILGMVFRNGGLSLIAVPAPSAN